MKLLACLDLAVALGIGFATTANADSIVLRFLGVGESLTLTNALEVAGVDLEGGMPV